MIEEGRPCLEVAQQLQAVHRAIGNAKGLLVQDHVEHCLDPAALADLNSARKVIKELREISKYL
jgi:DNA-binding FrmR family transcriptional regulator